MAFTLILTKWCEGHREEASCDDRFLFFLRVCEFLKATDAKTAPGSRCVFFTGGAGAFFSLLFLCERALKDPIAITVFSIRNLKR